jgi:flagellar basal-body rod protein FlgG
LMPDGTTAYTRDGSFQTDNQGQMVTSSGFPIQPAIVIPANATAISISRDGIVSVTVPGTTAQTEVGSLQLATFINPAGLESKGENLYVETTASGNPTTNNPGTNGAGYVKQNYVETSNVNVVEEMVNMIQTQRAYEINSKAITTSDQMLQRLTQL